MTNLDDALGDLLREVGNGKDYVSSAKEVAEDYGLHVNLLMRRFEDRYQSAEAARDKRKNALDFSKMTKIDKAKAEAFIRKECVKIGLNPEFYLPITDRKEILLRFEGGMTAIFANLLELKIESKPVFAFQQEESPLR